MLSYPLGWSSKASAKARSTSNTSTSESSESESDDGFATRNPAGYPPTSAHRKKLKKEVENAIPRPFKKGNKYKTSRHGYDEYGDYEDGGSLDEEIAGTGGAGRSNKRKRGTPNKKKKEARISHLRILARDLSDDDSSEETMKIESVRLLVPPQPSKAVTVLSPASGKEEDSEDLNLEADTNKTEDDDSENEDLSKESPGEEQWRKVQVQGSQVASKSTKSTSQSSRNIISPSPPSSTRQSRAPLQLAPPAPSPPLALPSPPITLPKLNVRPDFATTPEQDATPPFVLEPGVNANDPGIVVPQSINVHLRDYQRDGVRFLFDKWKDGRGGILGDDMGLGKTIQTIAFLTAIMKLKGEKREQGRRGRWSDRMREQGRMEKGLGRNNAKPSEQWPTCLIIAPAPVCLNWKRELETWTYASIGMYTVDEDKPEILARFKRGLFDIMIVGYETCRQGMSNLWDLDFSVIIADEVHKVKNPAAETSHALRQFDCKVRLGLTGTAIQNRDSELWCILDWCCPDQLGTLVEWTEYITIPLRLAQSHDASPDELLTGRVRARQLVKFILPRFFLRRTKQLIAHQLPKKFDFVVICEQTSEQTRVINLLRSTENVQLLITKDDLCDCGSGLIRGHCHYLCNEEGVKWQDMILKYCTVFRKVANHLALLLPSDEDNPDQRALAKAMTGACFPTWNPEDLKFSIATLKKGDTLCGKWKMLRRLLDQWESEDKGHKVLIFSMSTQLLKLIRFYLESEMYRFASLTGADPMNTRMSIIDKFQNDPSCSILLVSTLAGGVGLNLTAANKVVIFDPSWNPANDLQAMDRAFRIGQERGVEVYRLILGGSIEEIIHERQLYKRAGANIGYEATLERRNFSGVMDDFERRGELFGLKNLFSQREDGLATADMNERVFQAELKCRSESKEESEVQDKSVGDAMDEDIQSIIYSTTENNNPAEGQLPDKEILNIFAEAGATYLHLGDAPLGESGAEREILRQAKTIRKSNPAKAKSIRAYDLLGDWQRGESSRKLT